MNINCKNHQNERNSSTMAITHILSPLRHIQEHILYNKQFQRKQVQKQRQIISKYTHSTECIPTIVKTQLAFQKNGEPKNACKDAQKIAFNDG